MRDVQPFLPPGAVAEALAGRIPAHPFSVVIGQVHQMANRRCPGAGLDVANRQLPAA